MTHIYTHITHVNSKLLIYFIVGKYTELKMYHSDPFHVRKLSGIKYIHSVRQPSPRTSPELLPSSQQTLYPLNSNSHSSLP